jgi:hypothetical protein
LLLGPRHADNHHKTDHTPNITHCHQRPEVIPTPDAPNNTKLTTQRDQNRNPKYLIQTRIDPTTALKLVAPPKTASPR